MEVTLTQILQARENRAARQKQWLLQFGTPIVCFCMNIPGPIKDSPLIRRGFRSGCEALDCALAGKTVVQRQIFEAVTGWEAMYAVDLDPLELKRITVGIEDTHGLGRLFDMDVISPDQKKLNREAVNGKSRDCIVCGAPGRGCASRRIHSSGELQNRVRQILITYFAETDALHIGDLAVRSLLEEVETTPKPGLVDLRNSGSHTDMDVDTFRASAASLRDYFRQCARIGMDTAEESPSLTFPRLRVAGQEAERRMYAATGGVNTHKGAIFTLGVLCGAVGRLWDPVKKIEEPLLFQEVSAMTREAMEEDFRKGGDTTGHALFAALGVRGIRGQAADGLPAVETIGLKVYRQSLNRGQSANDAGVRTLLTLISRVEDTNMIARGGREGARAGAEKAENLLSGDYTAEDVQILDDWFVERNLSPGGCADLLAAVYFVHGLSADKKSV